MKTNGNKFLNDKTEFKCCCPACSTQITCVMGEHGIQVTLHDVGITYNDINPDYIVVGEARGYNLEMITRAIRLMNGGAKLIGTNYDLTGPTEFGIAPACRALPAPIELATGKQTYYVGKPNSLMMRTGSKLLSIYSEDVAIIGDRMDTDIIAGIESCLDTTLVLSGVTTREDCLKFPYKPRLILNGIGDIPIAAKDKECTKSLMLHETV